MAELENDTGADGVRPGRAGFAPQLDGADLSLIDHRDTRMAIEASLMPPLFERPGVAMIATDMDGVVTAMSPPAEALLGFVESELVGECLHGRVHYQRADGSRLPETGSPLLAAVREARAAAGDDEVFARRDGTLVPVSWAVAPIVIAGVRTGAVLAFYEATAPEPRRTPAEARLRSVEAANVRLTLLADASHVLLSAPDLRTGLAQVERLLVPVAADWAVIDLLDGQTGQVELAALAHRDPQVEALGRRQLGSLPRLRPGMTGPFARVLAGGAAEHVTRFACLGDAQGELDAARLRLFHLLGATEAITAPLRTRTRTVGAITVVRNDPARPYEAADVTFVTELATRVALAAENAVLIERYERRAETLQLALLPDVPAVLGGARLVHLYRPTDDLTHVGGDWYDAFPLLDGSTALVIGDVAGHDAAAAARMGAVRHKLRGIACDRMAPPSQVLRRLDAVIRQLAPGDLVTLIYARLVQDDGARVLEWSSAGHLPPLLLAPGETARFLDGEPDPPIGVADVPRTDHRLELPAQATLVLYTDGLVERPDESIDRGLARLLACARTLEAPRPGGPSVDDVPAQLLHVLEGTATDDVALLAVHLAGRTPTSSMRSSSSETSA